MVDKSRMNPYLVTIEQVREFAATLKRIHKDSPTSRPLSHGYEFVGAFGQWKFARVTGLPLNMEIDARGDGGKDFPSSYGDIDVKTARKPTLLRVANKRNPAPLLVLGHWKEGMPEPVLMGWEWDVNVVKVPPRDTGRGIVNHALEAHQLRPMDILLKHLEKDRVFEEPR